MRVVGCCKLREERLELSWVAPLEPKSSASANFATLAQSKTGIEHYLIEIHKDGSKSVVVLWLDQRIQPTRYF